MVSPGMWEKRVIWVRGVKELWVERRKLESGIKGRRKNPTGRISNTKFTPLILFFFCLMKLVRQISHEAQIDFQ